MIIEKIPALKGLHIRFNEKEQKTIEKFVDRGIYDTIADFIKLTLTEQLDELERGDYVKIEDPQ